MQLAVYKYRPLNSSWLIGVLESVETHGIGLRLADQDFFLPGAVVLDWEGATFPLVLQPNVSDSGRHCELTDEGVCGSGSQDGSVHSSTLLPRLLC